MIFVFEPSVIQHKHLATILSKNEGVKQIPNDIIHEANNVSLFKKVFTFNTLKFNWRSLPRGSTILFVASELQFILLFPYLRALRFKIKFVIHEPNLPFTRLSFILRNIVHLWMLIFVNKIYSFKKLNFFNTTLINLWFDYPKNLKFSPSKSVLSFGSETKNKRIDLLDINWRDIEFTRAGKTFYKFKIVKKERVLDHFITNDLKQKLFVKNSFSILPYESISQSMVIIEALSYGHILILNRKNTRWSALHKLSFVYTFERSPSEILPLIHELSPDKIEVLRKQSRQFFLENYNPSNDIKLLIS